ncbi:hypothetical protein [Burkholderia metallica]|uniref:hypothetical protein n=1 Tax=Burkholderia metallica TaxID=488729 RepID=UPI001FC7F7B4|nr:hypothetical protein [Burkholderia metallica]
MIANGFHLDDPIVVVPHSSLAKYLFAGIVVSLLYVWWRPYISYVELQVKRHMDDWYRAVCEAERSGRLY